MRIVVFAYACEPERGSEPGAGWVFARMVACLGETWVLTRTNHREAIERALPTTAERDRLHFVYVDLPEQIRARKRARKGIPPYVMWLFFAIRRARAMHRELRFDLAWHATFANAWIGSTASLLPVPFVFGPVGGAVKVPLRLAPALGPRGIFYEMVRSAAVGASRYLNPLARVTWRKASLILVTNPETRAWLPRRQRSKAHLLPNVVLDPMPEVGESLNSAGHTALFAGRLLPWKGAALAVRSLVDLPGWTLRIAGKGPEEARLRLLASKLDVSDRVQFLGHVSRARLMEMMQREVRVLLFPSMREDGGWVVGEAVASGLPVVCLDRGGPPVMGGSPVEPSSVIETSRDLARRVREVDRQPVRNRSDLAFEARRSELQTLMDRAGMSFAAMTLRADPFTADVGTYESRKDPREGDRS